MYGLSTWIGRRLAPAYGLVAVHKESRGEESVILAVIQISYRTFAGDRPAAGIRYWLQFGLEWLRNAFHLHAHLHGSVQPAIS